MLLKGRKQHVSGMR